MEESSIETPPPYVFSQPAKLFTAAVVTIYLISWALVPADWSPLHAGGKWFLGVFVVTSGVAAWLTSGFLFDRKLPTRDQPAVWLGIQVLFWNPLAYRAVLAAVEAVGLPSDYSGAVAWGGLLLLGLPTSLLGLALCRIPSWIAVYATRVIACFVTTWLPLIPALIFLHVLMFAHLVTWHRYNTVHRLAVGVIIAEQLAAFVWVFLFGNFD